METGFTGQGVGEVTYAGGGAPSGDGATPQPADQTEKLGPLLDGDASEAFRIVNDLVLRQEIIARNHLALDSYYTAFKLGYPWGILEKDPNRSIYTFSYPYGSAKIRTQAVPNKAWDLINKTTETLLVDFPQGEAEPADDSEEAEAAVSMANRFLTQDGTERGTNDTAVFHDRVERALSCASSYIEVWVDPMGGGYIPLQIEAHPQAESPDNALVGPDGNPAPDGAMVLRYVTAPTTPADPATGAPASGAQFTEDPRQAARQWQPKVMAAKWEREHIRVYPESVPVDQAQKVIILGFCTVGEARRRWPDVAAMDDGQIAALVSWTPPRYLSLLPPFQRGRFRLTDGRDSGQAGSSEERILFYYHVYARDFLNHPKGADVVLSGGLGGVSLFRDTLSCDVEVIAEGGTGRVTETRCLEIPVIQVTPRGDPDEKDPSGRAYVEMFIGAVESNAMLAQSFASATEKALTQPYALSSTSSISGDQIEAARATGDMLRITRPEDVPHQLDAPVLPAAFEKMYELADEAINSIASAERAATNTDNAQERSGKAIQLAVAQNNKSLTGMASAISNAYARFLRIKIEQAMAHFSTAQQIAYVGDDGAYKQEEWTGVDFALVGQVTITGGGTMMTPDAKVQYVSNLQAAGLVKPEEAAKAARPAFSKRLGLLDDPAEQRIQREVAAYLNGAPSPEWEQQYAQWSQAQQVIDQQAQVAAQQQQMATMATMAAQAQGVPPQPAAPVPPQQNPVPAPYNPFLQLPNDDEQAIASGRRQKLSDVLNGSKFQTFGPGWQEIAKNEYLRNRTNEANAAAAAVQAAQPQQPVQPMKDQKPPQEHAA